MKNTVTVLGAGIVGVSCALELQRRGYVVTILDRSAPGQETSYGNAGVMARSSLMPYNNPGLWASLPRLLLNRSAQLRYNPWFLARNPHWGLGYLIRARRKAFDQTTVALDALIRLSAGEHARLLAEAGALHRLRENGWIFLYRNAAAFESSRLARDTFDQFDIATQQLNAAELSDLEPDLKPIFPHSLWIKDTTSVDNPGRIVEAYANLFVARGGRIKLQEVADVQRITSERGFRVITSDGCVDQAENVVIALGPWSKKFIESRLGLSVPMAFERGYHMHYDSDGGARLSRPVYDTGGGYVLAPMEQGLRLSTGVELTDCDAPMNLSQLTMAESSAREAFPLRSRLDPEAWLGRRPTFPDCRPVIGPSVSHPGIWFAFGHQHVGFGTGPGTAAILGALMDGQDSPIDPGPFTPSRFIR